MAEMNQKWEEPREIERAGRGEGGDVVKINETEEVRRIAPWTKQITVRGLVASLIIEVMYSVIVMKLNLMTCLVPNLNVSVALLAFIFVRSWTKLLKIVGIVSTSFTKKENTVIQTCVVACYSIAVGGGFGSYLLGLNRRTYEQAGVDTVEINPDSVKEPGVGWMTAFLFVSSFVGLLALVLLRKNGTVGKFEISKDMFWKDGEPFQIIGGDLPYFQILPEYWEDRLLRAKALRLNTIQTHVPWNLHEPKPGQYAFREAN